MPDAKKRFVRNKNLSYPERERLTPGSPVSVMAGPPARCAGAWKRGRTGPEALWYADIAARFSAVFAQHVTYADLPPGRARALMLANGLSSWEADGNIERFAWIRQGGAETVTGSVHELTGTSPRPVQDWLSESRASFSGLL